VQWIEEGEKPTKYFCGLESKIFTSKIIPKIERDDGKTITNLIIKIRIVHIGSIK
jgi:hypothetical protein